MLSPDLLDVLSADREREIQKNLRVRGLLRRLPAGARPLTGVARLLRGAIGTGPRR